MDCAPSFVGMLLTDLAELLWRGHTPEGSGRYLQENSLLALQLEVRLHLLDWLALIVVLGASMSVM